MTKVQCQTCHAHFASYDPVHFGSIETGYRDLCSRCFNEEVARKGQLEFEQVGFQPVDMSDAAGVKHRFHFLLLHLGDRVALEAFEVRRTVRQAGRWIEMLDEQEGGSVHSRHINVIRGDGLG